MAAEIPVSKATIWERLPTELRNFASRAPSDVSQAQKTVYALLSATFSRYADGAGLFWGNELFVNPILAVVGSLILWALMALASLLLFWLPDLAFDILVYIPIGAFLLIAINEKWSLEDRGRISFWNDTSPNSLVIGRMEPAFGADRDFTVCFLLMLIASEGLAMHYTRSHLGVSDYTGAGDAIGLTVDNFLGALSFDVYEIYGITVHRHNRNSVWSANNFQVFRAGVLALSLFLAVIVCRRRRLRGFLDGFGEVSGEFRRFADWLDAPQRFKGGWSGHMVDECLFLQICAAYLRGDYLQARQWTRRFPNLQISSNIRAIFVDPAGVCVFDGHTGNVGDSPIFDEPEAG